MNNNCDNYLTYLLIIRYCLIEKEMEQQTEKDKEKEIKIPQEEKDEIIRKIKDIQAKDALRVKMRTKNLNTNKKFDMSKYLIILIIIITSVL